MFPGISHCAGANTKGSSSMPGGTFSCFKNQTVGVVSETHWWRWGSWWRWWWRWIKCSSPRRSGAQMSSRRWRWAPVGRPPMVSPETSRRSHRTESTRRSIGTRSVLLPSPRCLRRCWRRIHLQMESTMWMYGAQASKCNKGVKQSPFFSCHLIYNDILDVTCNNRAPYMRWSGH